MIGDELIKREIQVLINQRKDFTRYDDMINNMRRNLIVDDKVIEEDIIINDKRELENISKEINNGVIPRLMNLL